MRYLIAAIPLALSLAACQSPGTTPPETEDRCGAGSRQNLVGTQAADLDTSTLPEFSRIIHPRTPVTMDYRLERLNVHVDEDGKITRVVCG